MSSSRIRLFRLALSAILAFGSILGNSTLISQAAPGATLTPIGKQAFQDLTTCLTSGKSPALDVFYLIDNSGSLDYTDSNSVRRDVLKNSVAQLENFSDQGIKVRYSAAFFSSGVRPIQSWKSLETSFDFTSASSNIENAIEANRPDGYTDWERGINYAKSQFSKSAEDTCKMLVWFTDGGINPESGLILSSLQRLCNDAITEDTLPLNRGNFGSFNDLREDNVSVFGLLYQNDSSSLDYFEENYKGFDSPQERLDYEHYLMSYMTPLVEGKGTVEKFQGGRRLPPGGKLQCGELGENGLAANGRPNGAFLRAEDPVDLAYQFLKMQAQIGGGFGQQITDGKFEVPRGAAKFQIITTAKKWSLTGPDSSKVKLTNSSPSKGNFSTDSSTGPTRIEYRIAGDSNLTGSWKFDAPKGKYDLYVFSGLTMELDNDLRSQIVGGRSNSLSGRVVRTDEFKDFPVDLSLYDTKNLKLAMLDRDGKLSEVGGLNFSLDNPGDFKVEGLNPPEDVNEIELWLTLSLGDEYSPVESRFVKNVVSRRDIATTSSDVIKMTTLEGPKGVAKGSISVIGPTTRDSGQYCLDSVAIRTSDNQSSATKHPRLDNFKWKFIVDGKVLSGDQYCIDVANGETKVIQVEARNSIQADSHVTSIREVSSEAAGKNLAENLQFEFQSKAESNSAAEIGVIAALLFLGILLPLLLLYFMNWLTTKFLPMADVVKAELPVKIGPAPARQILDSNGQAITVDAKTFDFQVNSSAARKVTYGSVGIAQSKLPIFPFASTWFQLTSPEARRSIHLYDNSSKSAKKFVSGKAAEISANHSDNWILSIPESELLKADSESMSATLLIHSRMGSLSSYQNRVLEITRKPGFAARISEIQTAMAAEKPGTSQGEKGNGDGEAGFFKSRGRKPKSPDGGIGAAAIPKPDLPIIPGVTPPPNSGLSSPPSVSPTGIQSSSSAPASPTSIPGVTPPTIPGVTPPPSQ